MKKHNILLLVAILLVLLAGTALAKPTVVGLTTITLQAEFFQEVNKGALDAAAELGITLLTNDPQFDSLNQIAAIENFIQSGAGAIILLAVDQIGIVATVEDVVNVEGIPVIAVDAFIDSDSLTTFIGTANYESGYRLGQWVADYVDANMGGSAKLGINSAFHSQAQLDRQYGFVEAIEEHGGIDVVAVVDGKNQREEALSAAENLLMANPELDLIYGTGEPSVLGSLAAIQSQGRNEVKVLGWDLTDESVQGIRDGSILAMIQQDPYMMGYTSVKVAFDAINGQQIDKNIGVDVIIYTEENLGDL